MPLLLAVTLPWFVAIGIASHGEFFRSSLGQDFATKLQSGQEAHGAPPGYYFVAFWLTFWPATLFVTWGAVRALWRGRRSRRFLFLLAWIVPWWLLIEFIPTKLPHYALPLYPAIAMAAVLTLQTGARLRLGVILWATLAAVLTALALALLWIAEAPQLPLAACLLAVFAAAAAVAAAAAWRGYWRAALGNALLSSWLLYVTVFQLVLPNLKPMWIGASAASAASAARALTSCPAGPVGFAGFGEPSLVFLNGTDTLLTGPVPLAHALASDAVGLAFVSSGQREKFEGAFLDKTGTPPRFLGCVDGIGVNGKGPIRLQVYASPKAQMGCKPLPALACEAKETVRWRRLFRSQF